MNERERRVIRDLISVATNALAEGGDDEEVVAEFLERASVQAATLLYREVLRRRGMAEEGA